MSMSKLFYPVVFHKGESDEKGYWAEFPDLPGCFSDGNDINETMEHAQEALALYLEQSDIPFAQSVPQPSDIDVVMKQFPNETVVLVEYDAEKAFAKGINFSQVL